MELHLWAEPSRDLRQGVQWLAVASFREALTDGYEFAEGSALALFRSDAVALALRTAEARLFERWPEFATNAMLVHEITKKKRRPT